MATERKCPNQDKCAHPAKLRIGRTGCCTACGTQITNMNTYGARCGTYRADIDYYGSPNA